MRDRSRGRCVRGEPQARVDRIQFKENQLVPPAQVMKVLGISIIMVSWCKNVFSAGH